MGSVRLRTSATANANIYKSFEPLRIALSKPKVHNAILDGELVCLDHDGRSLFKELPYRRGSPDFYAFDLIRLDDHDLRDLPLIERKQRLRKLIFRSQPEGVICAGGKVLYAAMLGSIPIPLHRYCIGDRAA